MVYAQPRIVQKNKTHKVLWDFKIQTDHLILARWSDLVKVKKKKEKKKKTILADHRIKLKESEKRDKYFDLDREVKKTMEQ